MNISDCKKEFGERFKFLHDNANYLILPMMRFDKVGDSYEVRYKADNEMCLLLESFLLGDKPLKKTLLFGLVHDLKLDSDYNKKYSNSVLQEFYFFSRCGLEYGLDDNSSRRGVNYLLNLVSSYINGGVRSLSLKEKKLLAINQYYDLNGTSITDSYDSYPCSFNFYSGLGQARSNFIDVLSDEDNYDGSSILKSDEREKLLAEVNLSNNDKSAGLPYKKIY